MELPSQDLKDSIIALLKLQEIDGILFKLNEESSKPSPEFVQADQALQEAQRQVKTADKAFKDLDRERRGLELKHITFVEDLRKAETKRKEVRNTKEEFSANKEYENFQRKLQEIERLLKEKEIATKEKQDALNAALSKEAEAKKKLEELTSARNTRLESLGSERSDLVAKREAYISKAHPNLFSLYERVQKLRKGSGIAVVRGGICTGCHVSIPPQQKAKLQQMTSLITCSSCSRILCPEQILSGEETPLKQANS